VGDHRFEGRHIAFQCPEEQVHRREGQCAEGTGQLLCLVRICGGVFGRVHPPAGPATQVVLLVDQVGGQGPVAQFGKFGHVVGEAFGPALLPSMGEVDLDQFDECHAP
jgi:hypothetical protein